MGEGIDRIQKLEQATVIILNTFSGWDLEWTGDDQYYPVDAIGYTPKGFSCAMEMKFRNKYYPTKMLEVDKYNRLMNMNVDVRLYFVGDSKGNYMFWLDDLKMPDAEKMWCPSTTLWNNQKKEKLVYMLDEKSSAETLVY
jgi:hypothetical protein